MRPRAKGRPRPKRATVERSAFSHWDRHGAPKVSFLSAATALQRAARMGPLANTYAHCRLWHIGRVRRSEPR